MLVRFTVSVFSKTVVAQIFPLEGFGRCTYVAHTSVAFSMALIALVKCSLNDHCHFCSDNFVDTLALKSLTVLE